MESKPWSQEQQDFACELFKYKEKIERFLRRFGVDGTVDYEDLFQNSVIKAVTHRDQFNGDAQLSSWLTRIAINEFLDTSRKEKTRRHILGEIVDPYVVNCDGDCESRLDFCLDPVPNPEEIMITRNLLAEIRAKLSEDQWWLLQERYYFGKQNKQIEKETGIGEDTLKIRVFRSLSELELHGILPPNRILGPKKSYKKRKPKTLKAAVGR